MLHAADAPDGADDGRPRLPRQLGPVDLRGFGTGVVIGTGVFTLTGIDARQHAGPAVVLFFLFAGVASALAALCCVELASTAPTAGSTPTPTRPSGSCRQGSSAGTSCWALACVDLMAHLSVETWLRLLAWLVLGLLLDVGYGRRHARVRRT